MSTDSEKAILEALERRLVETKAAHMEAKSEAAALEREVERLRRSAPKRLRETEEDIDRRIIDMEGRMQETVQSLAAEKKAMRQLSELRKRRGEISEAREAEAKIDRKMDALRAARQTMRDTITGMEELRRATNRIKVAIRIEQQTGRKVVPGDLATIDVSVPKEKLQFVIGRGGATCRGICAAHAVDVDIRRKDSIVRITGEPASLDAARDDVLSASLAVSVKEPIDGATVQLLLSNSGAGLRHLEAAGCTVDVRRDGDQRQLVFTGAEARVAAAKDVLAAAMAGAGTLPVPARQTRFFIANKGEALQKIQSDTGAYVALRNGTATVYGFSADAVAAGLAAVQAVLDANPVVTETLTLPPYVLGAVIGSKGATVNKLQKESGAEINVSRDAGTVEVFGTAEEVAAGTAAVRAFVAQYERENAVVPVDSATARLLDAEAGAERKRIAEEAGCTVEYLPSRGGGGRGQGGRRVLRIKGEAEAVEKAKALVEEVAARVETETVTMPVGVVGTLIGKGGAVITKLQKETGADVDVVKKGDEGVVTIRGSAEAVAAAKTRVEEIVENNFAGEFTIADPGAVVAFIGKGGEHILQLQKDHGVEINVRRPGGDRRPGRGRRGGRSPRPAPAATADGDDKPAVCVVSGNRAKVEAAVEALKAEVEAWSRENASHAVGSAVVEYLMSAGGERLRALKEAAGDGVEVTLLRSAGIVRFSSPDPEKLATAAAALAEAVEAEGGHEATVPVETSFVGLVIGSKGATFARLQAEHDVRLDFERSKARIVIRGKEDAVAAAKAGLEAHMAGLTVTEDVHLPGRVSADRLATVADEFGATILPARGDKAASDRAARGKGKGLVVSVRCPMRLFRAAKEALALAASGRAQATIRLRPAVAAALATKGAENLERVQTDAGAKVVLDVEEARVRISGSDAQVGKARRAVFYLLSFMFPGEFATTKLSSDRVAFLTAAGGKALRAVQAASGATIDVDRSSGFTTFHGTPEEVAEAPRAVEAAYEQYQRENVSVRVPANLISLLIGPKGANIKKLQAETGAVVHTPALDATVGRDIVRVQGPEEKVQAAVARINEMVAAEAARQCHMELPGSAVAAVIGTKGETVQSIERETGARVKVGSQTNDCVITGEPEAIAAAKAKVEALVAQAVQRDAEFAARREAEREERAAEDRAADEKRREDGGARRGGGGGGGSSGGAKQASTAADDVQRAKANFPKLPPGATASMLKAAAKREAKRRRRKGGANGHSNGSGAAPGSVQALLGEASAAVTTAGAGSPRVTGKKAVSRAPRPSAPAVSTPTAPTVATRRPPPGFSASDASSSRAERRRLLHDEAPASASDIAAMVNGQSTSVSSLLGLGGPAGGVASRPPPGFPAGGAAAPAPSSSYYQSTSGYRVRM